jgi:hypothetical protein
MHFIKIMVLLGFLTILKNLIQDVLTAMQLYHALQETYNSVHAKETTSFSAVIVNWSKSEILQLRI